MQIAYLRFNTMQELEDLTRPYFPDWELEVTAEDFFAAAAVYGMGSSGGRFDVRMCRSEFGIGKLGKTTGHDAEGSPIRVEYPGVHANVRLPDGVVLPPEFTPFIVLPVTPEETFSDTP